MRAINAFLDESIVLPPGNWDNSNLLNIQEIADIRRKKKERKEANQQIKKVESEKNMTKQEEAEKIPENEEKVYDPNDPMQRAPYFFGGMINDLKRRAPHYLSDFRVKNFVCTLISLINVERCLLILKKKSTLHAYFHPPRLSIS